MLIDVYHDGTRPEIRSVVNELIGDRLPIIGDHQVCDGSGGCGGHGHSH